MCIFKEEEFKGQNYIAGERIDVVEVDTEAGKRRRELGGYDIVMSM